MFSQLIINSPWYYFLLSLVLGAAFSLWLYYRNKSNTETPRMVLYGLLILRFFSISLAALLLLNILMRQLRSETENPVILLAIDNSSSMVSGADSSIVKTELIKQLDQFSKNIGKQFAVKTILFGNTIQTGEVKPTFNEKETDIETMVSYVDNNYSNLNVGAMVLVTDGIYNKGASPVHEAEKLSYPFYSIALGDTNEIKDVAIQKVNHNQVAYRGNDFPVEVMINATKFNGKNVTVSLFQNGTLKAKQELKITSDAFPGICGFTLNAGSTGVSRYVATVTVLDGEKNVSNNKQPFVVEVIDNKEKVLLLVNTPHPDVSAIRASIESGTAYELEHALFTGFKKPLKAYSLVIIHGFSHEMLQVINECRNNNIPYWQVNPATTENLAGLKITGSMNRFNDAEAVTEKSFGLFNVSPALKKFISEAPAVKTYFGNYNVNNGTSALINQRLGSVETDHPILLFSETNGLKSAVFVADGLWKWRLRDYAEHDNHFLFNELISKTVQYLSVKSDKSFFRVNVAAIVNENQPVELDAEVYNKSYEAITEPDVTLVLTDSAFKKFNYTFSKNNTSYKLNLGMLPAGEYKYEAQVKFNNEIFKKSGVIAVKEVMAEKLNTVANHALLYQLANRTNGKVYSATQFAQLEKELMLNEKIKPVTYSQTLTTSLIELKWIFWLIILLLVTEWFFRKRYLSI